MSEILSSESQRITSGVEYEPSATPSSSPSSSSAIESALGLKQALILEPQLEEPVTQLLHDEAGRKCLHLINFDFFVCPKLFLT